MRLGHGPPDLLEGPCRRAGRKGRPPYRVTTNNFLADGGDNYTVLREGTDRVGGDVDRDALVASFSTSSRVAPGPQNRITLG
jgi:2',3'-cyclic-nucleotide 2'-phosphodiesterase (5'-nucleotidase family)